MVLALKKIYKPHTLTSKKSCYDYNYARGCTNLGEILCKYGNYTNAKQEARDALNKAYYKLGDKKALDILNQYFSY